MRVRIAFVNALLHYFLQAELPDPLSPFMHFLRCMASGVDNSGFREWFLREG
jgi:hypothetical protein